MPRVVRQEREQEVWPPQQAQELVWGQVSVPASEQMSVLASVLALAQVSVLASVLASVLVWELASVLVSVLVQARLRVLSGALLEATGRWWRRIPAEP